MTKNQKEKDPPDDDAQEKENYENFDEASYYEDNQAELGGVDFDEDSKAPKEKTKI